MLDSLSGVDVDVVRVYVCKKADVLMMSNDRESWMVRGEEGCRTESHQVTQIRILINLRSLPRLLPTFSLVPVPMPMPILTLVFMVMMMIMNKLFQMLRLSSKEFPSFMCDLG